MTRLIRTPGARLGPHEILAPIGGGIAPLQGNYAVAGVNDPLQSVFALRARQRL